MAVGVVGRVLAAVSLIAFVLMALGASVYAVFYGQEIIASADKWYQIWAGLSLSGLGIALMISILKAGD